MRFVDRSTEAEPDSLAHPSEAVSAEMKAALSYYVKFDPLAPKAKGYSFTQYKGYDVTQALSRLFHNKCAYCESDLGDAMDVEHFRPKGGVTGVKAHKGYWWLAHRWTNLLPSCAACNQTRRQHIVTEQMTPEELAGFMAKKSSKSWGKANQFPVSGVRAMCDTDILEDEDPDLIDPTIEDPVPHFRWSISWHFSVIMPADPMASVRALATIDVFALNRVRLVQSRTRILTELRFQAEEIRRELEEDMWGGGAAPESLEKALKRVEAMRRKHGPDQPYSAMVKAFVDAFAKELQGRIA